MSIKRISNSVNCIQHAPREWVFFNFFFNFYFLNLKTCERDLLVVFIACSRISLKAATFTLTVAEILFQQCKSQG